jgi:hypothetical protein
MEKQIKIMVAKILTKISPKVDFRQVLLMTYQRRIKWDSHTLNVNLVQTLPCSKHRVVLNVAPTTTFRVMMKIQKMIN